MHEHQLALKPLYKLNRLLDKVLDQDADRDIRVQYYCMMADLNASRKELALSYDFTMKAIEV